MSTTTFASTEQASSRVQTIDEKEHENAPKEAQKKGNEEAVASKDGHGHHDVKEEVQLYALENAFSWPVSLVMGLDHQDHYLRTQARSKQEKHEEKEVQYAVENAFSWPVSFVMHLVHEHQSYRGAKAGNEKKEAASQIMENVETVENILMSKR